MVGAYSRRAGLPPLGGASPGAWSDTADRPLDDPSIHDFGLDPIVLLRILHRACIGLRRGFGLITVLTVVPAVAVGYSAVTHRLQMPFGTSHDCAYWVIYMASGQPGADPIAVHHCFAPTSFMGSKSDEEFQTAVRRLIPSQPREFEYVGSLPEARPDGTQGKIEIYVVRDPYPSSVYAFHMDQDGLIANVGAN